MMIRVLSLAAATTICWSFTLTQTHTGPLHFLARGNSSTPAVDDERGIVALDQVLRELSNPFTVLNVVARPEHADYATLAYHHKKLGARAVIVCATRGEAGRNARGDELGDELGVIRTQEALEAARVAGADVYFLNLRDPGYFKSPDQALDALGRAEALGRLVRAIRLLRPDVIIIGEGEDRENGLQRAVARLSEEAFGAAADPKRFEQADVEPWEPLRLYQRVTGAEADVILNLDEYDPLRGRTYAEIGNLAIEHLASTRPDRPSSEVRGERRFYKLSKCESATVRRARSKARSGSCRLG